MSSNEMMTAEVLDRAIDELLAGGMPSSEETELASEASRFASLFAAIPASPGRADVRRHVLTSALGTRRVRRFARRLVVVSATVSLLGGGLAVAARNATPGNPLFTVRRGLAAARVAVAFGDKAKAVALLDRAAGDVADAKRLAETGDADGAAAALTVFRKDINNARAEIRRLAPKERPALLKRAAALQAEAATVRAAIGRLHADEAGRDDQPTPSGSSKPGGPSETTDPSKKQRDPSEKQKDPKVKDPSPSPDPSPTKDPSAKKDKEKPRGGADKPQGSGDKPDDPGSQSGQNQGEKKKDRPAE